MSSEWLGAAWSGLERLGATRSDLGRLGATRATRATRTISGPLDHSERLQRPTLEAPIYLSARTIEQIRSIPREQLSSFRRPAQAFVARAGRAPPER